MNRKTLSLAFSACAVLGAGPLHAALPEATFLELRYASGYETTATRLNLPVGGTRSYSAGIYNFDTREPDGSFLGYCADPFQWASGSFHSYEVMPLEDRLALDPVRFESVVSLFGNAYAGSLLNGIKAAGFQLALWEVFNDDRNLGSGAVRITGSTNQSVVNEAQSLLAALPTWTTTGTPYELTFYFNDTYQDYLAVTGIAPVSIPAIPEPGNYAMLLAGLGLLGWTAARRQQRD